MAAATATTSSATLTLANGKTIKVELGADQSLDIRQLTAAGIKVVDPDQSTKQRPKLNQIHLKAANKNVAAPKIAKDHGEWVAARKAIIPLEKDASRVLDSVINARRDMPWEKVSKNYQFETSKDGSNKKSLLDLFGGKDELIIWHFMWAPTWPQGCNMCAFFCDGINGQLAHLQARGVNFVAIAKANVELLTPYATAKGWKFPMYSSSSNDFNPDYGVEATKEQLEKKDSTFYNYGSGFSAPVPQLPGFSVFRRVAEKDGSQSVYHTYSVYSRGLDIINGAHQLLDFTPTGRDGYFPGKSHV